MHNEIQQHISNEFELDKGITHRMYIGEIQYGEFNAPINSVEIESTKDIIDIVNEIAIIVGKSFGPAGDHTIIHKMDKSHSFSKDGWSILRDLVIDDPLSNTILDFIKNASRNMTTSVGDGSTSVVLTISALLEKFNEFIENSKHPKFVNQKLIEIFQSAIFHAIGLEKNKRLISRANTDVTIDDIVKIATVSSNSDMEIVNLIKDIYTARGFNTHITYGTKNQAHSSFEFISHFRINRGLINPLMANIPDESYIIAKHVNPKVLMISGEVVSVEHHAALAEIINHHFSTTETDDNKPVPLLIMANRISPQINQFMQSIIIQNRNNGFEIPLFAIEHSAATKSLNEKYFDLALYLGATIIETGSGDEIANYSKDGAYVRLLGSCEALESRDNETSFSFGKGDPDKINARIKQIQEGIIDLSNIEDYIERTRRIDDLESRINELAMGTAKIYIGGNTAQEIKARGYLVDDTVKACRSAIKHGVVRGTQMFFPTLMCRYNAEITQYILDNFEKEFGSLYTFKSVETLEKVTTDLINITIDAFELMFSYLYPHAQELGINISNTFTWLTQKSNEDKIFDARSYTYTDVSVINPLETEEKILQHAFTQVKLLLNTSQIVVAI